MNRFLVSLLCLTLVFSFINGSLFSLYASLNEKYQRDYKFDKLKEAHYFTKHLDNLDFESARSNGLVNLNSELFDAEKASAAGNFVSYAGYFTVNKECNSNLYTWFFKNKVIFVWLVIE